jgi:hypothetical protein
VYLNIFVIRYGLICRLFCLSLSYWFFNNLIKGEILCVFVLLCTVLWLLL